MCSLIIEFCQIKRKQALKITKETNRNKTERIHYVAKQCHFAVSPHKDDDGLLKSII